MAAYLRVELYDPDTGNTLALRAVGPVNEDLLKWSGVNPSAAQNQYDRVVTQMGVDVYREVFG